MSASATVPSANPAPLGLLGFGMTTVLLNIHNAGFFPISAMILAMGVFYGGIAQVIAGLMEYRKGNTFAFTAFVSYGMFWLTLVGLLIVPDLVTNPEAKVLTRTPHAFMGCFLALWGLFTLAMFIATLRKPRALQVVFGSLVVLFALLAVRDFSGSALIGTIAGYEGLFCGGSAIYLAVAEILNETYGREVLPV